MAILKYQGNWASPPKPFRKRGDKVAIGKDISAEEAEALAAKWPHAFVIEGKAESARTVESPPNDRMRRGPNRKRGKADETD